MRQCLSLIYACRLPLAQVVLCECTPGWAGEFCEINYDACMGSPCFMGVLCIDEDPPSIDSTCGPCPEGLEGDGRTCKGEDPECPPQKKCLFLPRLEGRLSS